MTDDTSETQDDGRAARPVEADDSRSRVRGRGGRPAVPGTFRDPRRRALTIERLMEAPPRRQRARHAFELPNATEFSDDRRMRDPSWLVQQITALPEVWNDLERETTEPATYEKRHTGRKQMVGRDRMPGHWALAACAWIISKQTDLQTWHDYNADNRFWEHAGFEAHPSYQATHERIDELISYRDGFLHAGAKLWRLAMQLDEHVGRHIRIDGTAVQTHARMHHECTDPVWCAANGGGDMPDHVELVSADAADEFRQAENKLPPEPFAAVDVDAAVPEASVDDDQNDDHAAAAAATGMPFVNDLAELDLEELVLDELETGEKLVVKHRKYTPHGRRRKLTEHGEKEMWIRKGSKNGPKHRYVSRDTEAGYRIYSYGERKIKAWFGYLKLRAVDDYTGAEICSIHIPADQAEYKHFAELLERVRLVLGCYPEVVVADAGHSVRSVRRWCNARGVGLVSPFRPPNWLQQKREQLRQPGAFDEYSFCACEHCGSPGVHHRFARGYRGRPEVTFLCGIPHTPACTRRQKRACDDEPLLLGVVNKEEELYWELRRVGKPAERMHRVARARYTTGANNLDTRPRRIGLDFLRLRSDISHFVEILRVCLRHGWIGDYENRNPVRPRQRPGGVSGVKAIFRIRRAAGLLLPAGPQAEKLGLAWRGDLPDGWALIALRPERLAVRAEIDGRKKQRRQRRGRPGRKAPPQPPQLQPRDEDDIPF